MMSRPGSGARAARGAMLGAVVSVAIGLAAPGADADVPLIAAAASLRFAAPGIAARFAESSGERVELSFGASGNLSRQILRGAPYEVFLSADESYVARLLERGAVRDRGVVYAVGRLVLFVPAHSPLDLGVATGGELDALADVLGDPRLERLAIANPRHAPYGRAAREALSEAGLWDRLEPRLVIGENVTQAAQFALTEAVQAGLFARSLAVSPPFADAGRYALVPERLHRPLRQRMVLLPGAGGTARRFYAFMTTPSAREILARFGFSRPPPE